MARHHNMYICAWYSQHRQVRQVQPQHSPGGHNDTCTIVHGTATDRSYRYSLSTRPVVIMSFWNGGRSCWSLRPSIPVISRYKYRGHTGTASVLAMYTWHSERQVRHVQPQTCTIVQYMVQRQAGHMGTASGSSHMAT